MLVIYFATQGRGVSPILQFPLMVNKIGRIFLIRGEHQNTAVKGGYRFS